MKYIFINYRVNAHFFEKLSNFDNPETEVMVNKYGRLGRLPRQTKAFYQKKYADLSLFVLSWCRNNVCSLDATGCQICCTGIGRLVDRRNVNTSRTCPFHLAICSGRRFEWIVHFYVLKFCIHMLSVYLDGIEPTSLWFLLHGEPSKPKAKLMPSFSVKLWAGAR